MVFPWFLLVGTVLILMAFASRWVARLPLSFAIVYLAAGIAIGPDFIGLLRVDLTRHAPVVELLAEVAVLISLFSLGLRLRLPFAWRVWRTPVTLATVTMLFTIGGAAVAAHFALGLGWPVALLVGAILAPTDPVLASEVQVRHPGDRDALRVALTAEAGMNDGTAFPAVLLALVLLTGDGNLGRWLLVDVLWALAGAAGLGALCGIVLARAATALRRSGLPLEFEEFLAFGMIAVTYGTALVLHVFGFVAVFVAALAFAHGERRATQTANARDDADASADAASEVETANRLLTFSTQCERLVEVALVLLVGAALAAVTWRPGLVVFAALLFIAVRPLAVLLTVPLRALSPARRRALGWFGIRGIGSLYYLAYALAHAREQPWASDVVDATLATVAISIAVHGISATPLMRRVPGRSQRPPAGKS